MQVEITSSDVFMASVTLAVPALGIIIHLAQLSTRVKFLEDQVSHLVKILERRAEARTGELS